MPSQYTVRNVTPNLLRYVVAYVDTGSTQAVADQYGISIETVRSAIVITRTELRDQGYKNLGNQIGLRRALRHRGDLTHLDTI